MHRFVLDTNVLIAHWRRSRKGKPISEIKATEVGDWARRLIDVERTSAVVTPVVVEFLCGISQQSELNLARSYLKPFQVIDNGKMLVGDWREAERLAARVPPSGRPRDLGDCLIRAIAARLHYEVRTFDRGMPR
jgi:predicted nucleic acid-binding protein